MKNMPCYYTQNLTLTGKGETIISKPFKRWYIWPVINKFHYFHTGSEIRFYLVSDSNIFVSLERSEVGTNNTEVTDHIRLQPEVPYLVNDRISHSGQYEYSIAISRRDNLPETHTILSFHAGTEEEYSARWRSVAWSILIFVLGVISTLGIQRLLE